MMNFQITAPIGPFCRDNGLGRTKVYELIGVGEIESVTIGRRRYIIVQSYIDFLRRQAQSAPALASPNHERVRESLLSPAHFRRRRPKRMGESAVVARLKARRWPESAVKIVMKIKRLPQARSF